MPLNYRNYGPSQPLEDGEKTRIVHMLVATTHLSTVIWEHGWNPVTILSVSILLTAWVIHKYY